MAQLVDLTSTVNDTLSPTIVEIDEALGNIDSANASLNSSDIQKYIDQVDSGMVRITGVALGWHWGGTGTVWSRVGASLRAAALPLIGFIPSE
jgi:hypothetical protein